jgi:hypothetical protein
LSDVKSALIKVFGSFKREKREEGKEGKRERNNLDLSKVLFSSLL